MMAMKGLGKGAPDAQTAKAPGPQLVKPPGPGGFAATLLAKANAAASAVSSVPKAAAPKVGTNFDNWHQTGGVAKSMGAVGKSAGVPGGPSGPMAELLAKAKA